MNQIGARAASDGGPPERLGAYLTRLVEASDPRTLVGADPVGLVRGYDDPQDREVAGVLVAMLAYGRASSIREKAGALLDVLGPRPSRAVAAPKVRARLSGFVYRFQRGEDLPRFAAAIARARRDFGSLGAMFVEGTRLDEPHYGPAMGRFVEALASRVRGEMTYGLRFLLPQPNNGGAAKRLCLYLRWMVRPDEGLDLGAWRCLAPSVDPGRLLIPLDTHIARIGRNLGLTERRSDDLITSIEITQALGRFRPDDPLVFDMALCHLGISGQCPRRRDQERCGACPIRSVCRLGPEPPGWRYNEEG